MKSITVSAPAKLNLTLDVLGKRPDGYHEMKMVMQSVTLADEVTLTMTDGEGIGLETDLAFLPRDSRNLAVAAAEKLQESTGADLKGLRIRIEKHIPVCAGTAGGSSDAAAVLRGLNELCQLGLSWQELARIGAGVGSDVPYCIFGRTALAEGRGELITPVSQLPSCWAVLCKPDFPISTPELFQRLDGQKLRCHPDTAGMLNALEEQDLTGVARRLFNVFEEVLPSRSKTQVQELKERLLDLGAMGACMSGTGPTVFGLFDQAQTAVDAAEEMKKYCPQTFLTQTI